MRASVVVPAHNAAATLPGCLDALLAQTLPRSEYEILVIDDGSADATAALAARDGVQVICTPHLGAAAARNTGARAAHGELLLFTDADCEPTPRWAEALVRALADPSVGGAKGIYGTRQHELIARFVQCEYEEKYGRMFGVERIDFVDTYSAGYRRGLFEANGGFDEMLPVDEDQEFSFRLAKQGARLILEPEAIVYHRHVARLSSYVARKFRIGYWKVRVHRRHPDKVWSDSHTPATEKLQVGLVPGILVALALEPFAAVAGVLALLLALLFALSELPLLRRIQARDRAVISIAPFLILARAAALAAGLGVGVLSEIGSARPVRRLFDVSGGLAGLILTLPLWPIIALAIKVDSPGPVLFRQQRAGQNGRPFTIYKFRTMVDGAEALLDRVIDQSHIPPPVFKIPRDPRVTRIGRILRRWSLDELPQFVNVLRGEMALVGPRPEELRVVARYNEWQKRRLACKPGITGPMQIQGRGELPLDMRVQIELEYIRHATLWTDCLYLIRTIPAVIRRKGAF